MKTRAKRIISAILVVVLMFTMFPLSIFAEAASEIPTAQNTSATTQNVSSGEFVAKIGNTGYKTLAAAVKAVQKGASHTTIYLLKDTTISNTMVGHSYVQNITIDLGGHTLSSSDIALTAYRAGTTLTVQNGTVSGNSTSGTLRATYNGTLILGDNLTVKGAGGGATLIYLDSGKLSITAKDGVDCVGGKLDFNSKATSSIVAKIGRTYFGSFADAYAAAQAGNTITLLANLTLSDILVIDKAITLNGNGKTLTSTAGRAINVTGADGVTIKNLTINASGERAINIIQNANNVTIENVTATAANYTVNVASSAPNAVVAIKNSTLTGLNVVNVAAEGAKVTINGGTITCNDQNSTENYAALSLNKDAVNGMITANGVTFDIKGDSLKASNGAQGGVITIDDKIDEVSVDVAYISYGNNYYGYKSLAAAIAAAKEGQTIVLLKPIVVAKGETLNLNKKVTITYTSNVQAHEAMITNNGTLIVDGAELIYTYTGAGDSNFGWGTYTIYNNGNLTVKSGKVEFVGNQAFATHCSLAIFQYDGSTTIDGGNIINNAYRSLRLWSGDVTINGGNFEGQVWVHCVNDRAELTINGGSFAPAKDGGDGSSVFVNNSGKKAELAVTGGNFATKIGANDVDALAGAITGGTFTEAAVNGTNAALLGANSKFEKNENGTYGVVVAPAVNYVAQIGTQGYATLADAIAAAKAGDVIELLADVTTATTIKVTGNLTLNGNGFTITYTGSDRAIDVPYTANGANVTIENLTVNCTASYCQRGINYNDDGALVLNKVTVKGTNVTYALNLPGYSDNCVVTITDSNFSGNIALNIWGANSTITATNSVFVSVDNSNAEGYVAISLNNDGAGNAATGSVVTINGGKIIAKDENGNASTAVRVETTATVNVSEETEVVGDTKYEYAIVIYEGYTEFYSFDNLQDAINKAIETNGKVVLINNITIDKKLTISDSVVIDGNGFTITYTGSDRVIDVPENTSKKVNVTIKNLTVNCTASYCQRGINYNDDGALVLNKVTVKGTNVTYALNLPGSSDNCVVTITDSNFSGNIALNVWGENATINATNTTFTAVDNNTVEGYAAVKLNNDGTTSAERAVINIVGGEIDVTGSACADTEAVSNGTATGVVNISDTTVVNGKIVEMVAVIRYVGGTSYSFYNLADAFAKAVNGDTITLLRDVTLSDILVIDKAITLDGNGKTLTSTAGRAINVTGADGVTIKNLTIKASGERAINIIVNATNVTIDNVTATAANYTVNVAASAPNAVVAIKNSTLTGLCTVNVAAAKAEVTIDNSTINCNDNNTTAGESYAALCLNKAAVGGSIIATNTTVNVTAGSDSEKGRNGAENGTVIINGSTEGVTVTVAVITYPGSDYYYGFTSLAAAIEFAKAGDTITLIRDVTTTSPITITKSLTIDGGNYTLTYTGTDRAIDVPNTANGANVTIKNLKVDAQKANRGLNYNTTGKFTVENVVVTIGANVDGYAINFPGSADGAKVTITNSKLTSRTPLNIWGENMVINVVDSEITSVDNSSTYFYSAIQLNNDGYNCANGTVVTVTGGKLTALDEKGEPSFAVTNWSETGIVNISNTTEVIGNVQEVVAWIGGAGFTSLQAAIDSKYTGTIKILRDFAISKSVTVPAGKNVTIDLNGKTITGTDKSTGSFALIDINPGAELTINDTVGTGKITLTATNNRGWGGYSSVVSVQRAKLTVNGGTLEHLGGSDMAYAIDVLTNTGAEKAEAVINGGTIKSTYRAIRQFANSTKAETILTVNGGTIEGANKSIWIQNANSSNNPAELVVNASAVIKGDVLVSGSNATAWNLGLSVASAALNGESTVVGSKLPATMILKVANGVWGTAAAVATVNGVGYATLAEAVAAAQNGDEIVLLADVADAGVISLKAGVTLNGNGRTISGNSCVYMAASGETAVKNVNFKDIHNDSNKLSAIYANGLTSDAKITITGCTFENIDWDSIQITSVDDSKPTVAITGNTFCADTDTTVLQYRHVHMELGATTRSKIDFTLENNKFYGKVYMSPLALYYIDPNGSTLNIDKNYIEFTDRVSVVLSPVGASSYNANELILPLYDESLTNKLSFEAVVVKDKYNAKIYATFADALAAAQAGNTITLLADLTLSDILVIDKAITLNGNGHKLTSTAGRAINIDTTGNVVIKDLIINAGERAINIINKASTVELNNVTATAKNNAVMIATSAGAVKLTINNSNLTGLAVVNVAGAGAQVAINNTTITNKDENSGETYGAITIWSSAAGADVVVNGGEINVADDSHEAFVFPADATIEGIEDVSYVVATVGDGGFTSLQAAIDSKYTGTITLLRDVTLSDILVIDKAITLDGNGKKLTSTAARAINIDTTGKVVIKDLIINAGERAINIINQASTVELNNVTATAKNNAVMIATSAGAVKLTINDSNLTGLAVVNVAGANAQVEINNTKITNVDASTAEQYGAITVWSSAAGAKVVVNGGNITVGDDSRKAYVFPADATIEGVEDVGYIVATIGDAGFETLEAAIKAAKAGQTIKLVRDVAISESLTVNKAITLDLNGKTITGTDNSTGSFGLININPGAELTINDTVGTGKITLKSKIDREWNAYSSVISNQRGKLIVNGGTIEHLGGTDMAYAIDNLTNGKGTYAETVINGGVIYSKYRAIRQFLNGTEAQNILTVNGGEITGVNKSIWMQDPSTNANTGTLTVRAEADIYGDIYLFVTAGSSEYPVTVSIAAAALESGSQVLSANFPDGYVLENVDGNYGVNKYVAMVGNVGYDTLADALAAAQNGDTIKLLGDITLTEKDAVVTGAGNSVKAMLNVSGKSITLDLNGHIIYAENNSDELIYAVVFVEKNAALTIKDSVGKGGIRAENVGTVTGGKQDIGYMIFNYSTTTGAKNLVIEGGNFYANNLEDSIVYSQGNETTVIKGGTFVLDDIGTRANGHPWIFNAKGQNTQHILVEGGSFNADVLHQYWIFEVEALYSKALKYNAETGMYTMVDAVAYVTERHWSGNWYTQNIGYATIEEAIAACQGPQTKIYYKKEYVSEPEMVVLLKNVEINNTVTIANGQSVIIDLMGLKIVGTFSGTGNQEMFLVKGNLTVKNGYVEMTATVNQGWNAMSTVFNVTAGGVLNIDKANIDNRGGTDMNFCVHLNNWGEVTLNVTGSTLKATYIPVRVFNSGNDKNNVTIEKSEITSGGSRAFWVHNYTAADFGNDAAKAAAHQALLNFNVFGNGNVYTSTDPNRVFEYGFTNAINFDANGNRIVTSGADLKDAAANGDEIIVTPTEGNKTPTIEMDKDSEIEVKEESNMLVNSNSGLNFQGNGTTIDANGTSKENGYVGFVPEKGKDATVENVTVTGSGFVEVGHHETSTGGTYTVKNLTIKDLVATLTVNNGGNNITAAFGHYGNATLKNCTLTGTTSAEEGFKPYDAAFVNGTTTTVDSSTIGKLYLAHQAKVTITNTTIDEIDSYAISTNNLGKLVIGNGAKIGTINLYDTDIYKATLTIQDGAEVGAIVYNGVTYTQAEWLAR